MDLNTFEHLCNTKIKNDFSLRKTTGIIAMFFAQRVTATKSIEFMIRDTVTSAVVIAFIISATVLVFFLVTNVSPLLGDS